MQDLVAGSLAEWTLRVGSDPPFNTRKTKRVQTWKKQTTISLSLKAY